MMQRLLTIITVLVTACGHPSVPGVRTQETSDSSMVATDNTDSKDPVASTPTVEDDTAYNNSILAYKDSIDNIETLREVPKRTSYLSADDSETVFEIAKTDTLKMTTVLSTDTSVSIYVYYMRHGQPVFYTGNTVYDTRLSNRVNGLSINNELIFRNDTIVRWMSHRERKYANTTEIYRDVKYMYDKIRYSVKQ